MLPSSRRVVIMLAVGWLLRAPAAAALDWPMYGRDLKHSFTNAGSLINAGNVLFLQSAWDFPTTDAVTASPTVVDGRVAVEVGRERVALRGSGDHVLDGCATAHCGIERVAH